MKLKLKKINLLFGAISLFTLIVLAGLSGSFTALIIALAAVSITNLIAGVHEDLKERLR